MHRMLLSLFLLSYFTICNAQSLPLEHIKLPKHFKISVYAQVPDARSLALGTDGMVFVGSRHSGKVYALTPKTDFSKANEVLVIANHLNQPNGVAYFKGDLYVAEVSRIVKFPNIESNLLHPKHFVLYDNLPQKRAHGWRYIGIGPDHQLYIGIGAACNVCIEKNPFATIARMKLDGTQFQIYAKGVRNTVGFDWNPVNHKLWFTDNGRDWLGDNLPPDELNYAPKAGMNFGFPYFWGNNQPDPEFGKLKSSQGMSPPALNLDAHVAPLGMRFYTGKQFPTTYHHAIFIAEHGSWNRSKKIGYRLILVHLKGNKVTSKDIFASGWLQGQRYWGRPVDVLILPDGSMLVSDDYAGVVYRIYYSK